MGKITFNNIILFSTVFLFFSCSGWTKKDESKYLIECQRAKLYSVFCECSLEKISTKYSSFEEAMYNEEDFLEIFNECKR